MYSLDLTTTSTQFQAVSFFRNANGGRGCSAGGLQLTSGAGPLPFLLVVAVFGRRCPRRARAGTAPCSARRMGFLSGPPSPSQACGPFGTSYPSSVDFFPFFWLFAGRLAEVVRLHRPRLCVAGCSVPGSLGIP